MKGKVKWFSQEKGYGFITGENNDDYYFNVRSVKGDLPHFDDVVEFSPDEKGEKGPRANSVVILEKKQREKPDDRVLCSSCGKKMVPRLITYHGDVQQSVCPFCAQTYKDFRRKCFIATAVYGDPLSPQLTIMRNFRDGNLRRHRLGRGFINVYEIVSPPIARLIESGIIPKSALRPLLGLIVNVLAKRWKCDV